MKCRAVKSGYRASPVTVTMHKTQVDPPWRTVVVRQIQPQQFCDCVILSSLTGVSNVQHAPIEMVNCPNTLPYKYLITGTFISVWGGVICRCETHIYKH